MMLIAGEGIADQDRLRRVVQVCLDVIIAPDAIHFGQIERPLFEGHPVGHIQPLSQRDHLIRLLILIMIQHGVDRSIFSRAHEERAIGAQGHRARIGHIIGVNADGESVRQADREGQGIGRRYGGGGRAGWRYRA